MGAELFDTLRAALDEASRTDLGRKAVSGHDEDFQIDVLGREPMHAIVAGGTLTVESGPSPRQQPMHFTRIELDESTLQAILQGALSPLEAMEQGRLFLRTRLYGGALITMLLRAAYDLARERALAKLGR